MIKGLPPYVHELLTKTHFAYLCTVDEADRPHVAPIFFAFTPTPPFLYFLTSSRSRKLSNLRSSPRAALTVDVRDPVDPGNNVGIQVKGTAEVLGPLTTVGTRAGWEEGLLEVFRGKYPVYDTWLARYISRSGPAAVVWVRVRPSKLTWWRYWDFKTLSFPIQGEVENLP